MPKILIKFTDKQVGKPITSQIILDLKIQLNILNANVTPQGGEILVEVTSKDVNKVVQALKKKNVEAIIQQGIEVDKEKCINCSACYSLCPVDAISIDKDYKTIFDAEKCISCSLCVDVCPTRALKV